MSVFSDEERALLDKIAIDMVLDRLSPLSHALVVCRFAYELPDDYAGPWPPRSADTGRYVGRRFLGKQLQATVTQQRTTRILAKLRRLYGSPTCSLDPRSSTPHPLRRAA